MAKRFCQGAHLEPDDQWFAQQATAIPLTTLPIPHGNRASITRSGRTHAVGGVVAEEVAHDVTPDKPGASRDQNIAGNVRAVSGLSQLRHDGRVLGNAHIVDNAGGYAVT